MGPDQRGQQQAGLHHGITLQASAWKLKVERIIRSGTVISVICVIELNYTVFSTESLLLEQ